MAPQFFGHHDSPSNLAVSRTARSVEDETRNAEFNGNPKFFWICFALKFRLKSSVFVQSLTALFFRSMHGKTRPRIPGDSQGRYRNCILATVREAVTIWCQRVPSCERNRRDKKSILWVFLSVSGLALFGLWVKLSVCSHTPTVHLKTTSRFEIHFFPMWPLIFCQHTIHQVIWTSPGTLRARSKAANWKSHQHANG